MSSWCNSSLNKSSNVPPGDTRDAQAGNGLSDPTPTPPMDTPFTSPPAPTPIPPMLIPVSLPPPPTPMSPA
jgi:hypothetical protein